MNACEAVDTSAALEIDTTAENRLMLAVLEEALATFRLGVTSDRPLRRKRYFEVARWFASSDNDWLFSFESICTSLGMDPDYLRAGLRQLERAAFDACSGATPQVPCAARIGGPRAYRVRS
ncbi:MAG TPA: hypothetical protein VEL28_08445 [Candidatus Binatia bacterium]|nr:hypothetical protein [Candidatus Binatia bacterium]